MRAVHLIIGTKAQFIKMAPIAFLLERDAVPYRLIDLSQHGALTGRILSDFGLNPSIRFLHPSGTNVSTYWDAVSWLTRCLRQLARPKEELRRTLLLPGDSPIALVHGDTLSTLLGTHLGMRLGIEVGLVEAGLSSGRLLSPFPEEAIRRHVEARASFLFAAGGTERQRLQQRGVRGVIIDTGYNTGRDAFHLVAGRLAAERTSQHAKYVVWTLHRAETISRKQRLTTYVRHVLALAERLPPIRFFAHEPTLKALAKAGLADEIGSHPRIRTAPLASYPEFVAELLGAEVVLTDGGSIQEEASYAHKPCLVLRAETEREHGLGTTARLTSLDVEEDLRFLSSMPKPVSSPTWSTSFEASRSVLSAIGVTN